MNSLFERVHRLDTLVFLWCQGRHGFPYRRTVRWISRTGDGYLYALAGALLAWLDPGRGRAFALAGVLAYTLERALYFLLKNGIQRDRPASRIDGYRAQITPSDRFSFPSGHTAAAFLFAALTASFYPDLAPAVYVWASLVGLSRVLLGVHYPGDIAAGALLGSGAAAFGLTLAPLLGTA